MDCHPSRRSDGSGTRTGGTHPTGSRSRRTPSEGPTLCRSACRSGSLSNEDHLASKRAGRLGSETIGGVGTTGVSTGVHLHYEYRQDDVDINPVPFLVREAHPVGIAATVKEALNLRSGPNKNAPVLTVVPAGAKVLVGQEGWVPVWHEGRQGWMWSEFLEAK